MEQVPEHGLGVRVGAMPPPSLFAGVQLKKEGRKGRRDGDNDSWIQTRLIIRIDHD
jgi:hypothetical protein